MSLLFGETVYDYERGIPIADEPTLSELGVVPSEPWDEIEDSPETAPIREVRGPGWAAPPYGRNTRPESLKADKSYTGIDFTYYEEWAEAQ